MSLLTALLTNWRWQFNEKYMKKEEARKLLLSLIEACNANGMFKKLADLDQIREAFKILADEKTT